MELGSAEVQRAAAFASELECLCRAGSESESESCALTETESDVADVTAGSAAAQLETCGGVEVVLRSP